MATLRYDGPPLQRHLAWRIGEFKKWSANGIDQYWWVVESRRWPGWGAEAKVYSQSLSFCVYVPAQAHVDVACMPVQAHVDVACMPVQAHVDVACMPAQAHVDVACMPAQAHVDVDCLHGPLQASIYYMCISMFCKELE